MCPSPNRDMWLHSQKELLPERPGQHVYLSLSRTFHFHTFLRKDTQRLVLTLDSHGFTFLKRELSKGLG